MTSLSLRRGLRWPGAARLAPVMGAPALALAGVLAAIAWAVSLPAVRVDRLGTYGLAAELPPMWYAALGVLLGAAVLALWATTPRPWLIAGLVGAVVVVLYATVPAVADAPQYTWTYKHIGVARLFELQGATSPDLDIYNRWPGFFAAAAAFSTLTGLDPLSYAGWAEPVFALVDALLVAALARALTADVRVVGMAALCFSTVNWVGQTYFAPQALAFTLDLVVMTLVLRRLIVPGAAEGRAVRLLGWVARRPQAPLHGEAPPAWSRRGTLAAVLLLAAVIAATHQLTPYILVLQLAVPTALGLLRPRWLFLATAAIAVAYLLPNLDFVERNYGLLSGLNPLDNSRSATAGLPGHRPSALAQAGPALTLALLASATLLAGRLVRAGQGARVAVLLPVALCPALLLFGQSYGGEAALRVVLFAAPFLSVLVALGIATLPARWRAVAALGLLGTFSALFVGATLGQAATHVVPRDVVAATDHFYAQAPPGSILVPAGPGAPLRSGARYAAMARPPGGDLQPGVRDQPEFAERLPRAQDMATLAHAVLRYSTHGFVIFSAPQERYAELVGPGSAGEMRAFERRLAASPYFRLWHRSRDARIYQVVGGDPWDDPASEAGRRVYERDAEGRAVLRVNRSGNARESQVYRTFTADGVTYHDYAVDGRRVVVRVTPGSGKEAGRALRAGPREPQRAGR